ncbi:hypothetical protein EAI_16117 [Harpegnathos saltator]|uniref:Uncharacterized protein n=1 Tax=Harpegnathos saltator TaxID=610380 RepID=E2C7N1_HARSA|nr:hypothetical protein EAI_16117 [Harpegnathos saltator]
MNTTTTSEQCVDQQLPMRDNTMNQHISRGKGRGLKNKKANGVRGSSTAFWEKREEWCSWFKHNTLKLITGSTRDSAKDCLLANWRLTRDCLETDERLPRD